MGAMKDFDRRIRQGGDDAIAAVNEYVEELEGEVASARACAEMMLQGTGQKLGEELARRVMASQDNWRWISVYERLPQDGQHVLAYGVGTGTGCVFSNGTFHYLSTQEYQQLHPQWWMPLPSPPDVT